MKWSHFRENVRYMNGNDKAKPCRYVDTRRSYIHFIILHTLQENQFSARILCHKGVSTLIS